MRTFGDGTVCNGVDKELGVGSRLRANLEQRVAQLAFPLIQSAGIVHQLHTSSQKKGGGDKDGKGEKGGNAKEGECGVIGMGGLKTKWWGFNETAAVPGRCLSASCT